MNLLSFKSLSQMDICINYTVIFNTCTSFTILIFQLDVKLFNTLILFATSYI